MDVQRQLVKRLDIKFKPDPRRVVANFYKGSKDAIHRIYKQVSELPPTDIQNLEKGITANFGRRHRDIQNIFNRYFSNIKSSLPVEAVINESLKNVLASYFTMEYLIEGAALFNPSITIHPDQSGIQDGQVRFILSLRATGERHISSLEFKSGILDRS